MAELAADACGPRKHGGHCGIAFVYRSLAGQWHADSKPLKKQYDATALELQGVALGMGFLVRQSFIGTGILGVGTPDSEVRVYSDASRLFEYLNGETVIERHQEFMFDIKAKQEIMTLNGVTVQFEQVVKTKRERYPLYLMADALSRHARTLPLA